MAVNSYSKATKTFSCSKSCSENERPAELIVPNLKAVFRNSSSPKQIIFTFSLLFQNPLLQSTTLKDLNKINLNPIWKTDYKGDYILISLSLLQPSLFSQCLWRETVRCRMYKKGCIFHKKYNLYWLLLWKSMNFSTASCFWAGEQ